MSRISIPAEARSYQLWIFLAGDIEIPVGSLGSRHFPRGWYVYTGSARRGIRARLRRHCAPPEEKRPRWHIDYLLADPAAEIRYLTWSGQSECRLNAATGGIVVCPGFGASDCRSRCGSHLRYREAGPG